MSSQTSPYWYKSQWTTPGSAPAPALCRFLFPTIRLPSPVPRFLSDFSSPHLSHEAVTSHSRTRRSCSSQILLAVSFLPVTRLPSTPPSPPKSISRRSSWSSLLILRPFFHCRAIQSHVETSKRQRCPAVRRRWCTRPYRPFE